VSSAQTYFLGVDGGATHCRARLRDGDGRLLGEAEGAAANVYVDFRTAIAAVKAVATAAIGQAPTAVAPDQIALGLGLAGITTEADARKVEARFQDFGSVIAENDAVTACLGAHGGADGAIIIAGTGSAAMARINGKSTVLGGRGFIVGDEGSAARIGLDAVRAAARAADGLGPVSALTHAVLKQLGGDVAALVAWAATAKPGDFGAFAPLTIARAQDGDEVALPIIKDASTAILFLFKSVRDIGSTKVALVGGLAPALRPFLAAPLENILLNPRFDACEGAILLAGGPLPVEEHGA
jgi:glucosamine kinase